MYLDKRDAVDVYGKKLPAPVLYIIGQGNGSYHEEAAWGMDVWPVGDSLGAGGPGVMRDGMATQVGDPRRIVATVEASGPEVAALRVEDDGWSVDRYRANLVAHYSIASGSRLTMVSASATRGAPLVAGFGKYPNTDFIRSNTASGWGYVATWGQQSENGKDIIGMALFYPLAEISVATDDGRSYYVRFKESGEGALCVCRGVGERGRRHYRRSGFSCLSRPNRRRAFSSRSGDGRREIKAIKVSRLRRSALVV